MDVRAGLWRKLSAEELMLLNCGVGEDSRVPWTARKSNQSILKEISPGCSLAGLMLKLKLQYYGHLMQRVDSFAKTLMVGETGGRGEGDDRRWDGWMASLTWWTWVWVNSRSWWWTGRPGMLWFMGSQRVGYNWATELNWTDNHLCSMALVVKNLPANTGATRDLGFIPGLAKSPGGGNGNPLQYYGLKNPMDRGARWATVHGVAESWT